MCYAIPGKLVSINGNVGVVDYFGEKRKVLLDFSEVSEGDYIYAQGGVCVNRVSESEALQALEAWKEVFRDLQKTDKKSATLPSLKKKGKVFEIIQKANRGGTLTDSEALVLLRAEDREEIELICRAANSIRQKVNKNACCVHGIIEFSNYCSNSCQYCGIRKQKDIDRYRMSAGEIENCAMEAIDKHGFRALLLQSGEDEYCSAGMLKGLVSRIRKAGCLVFLSAGTRDEDFYRELYLAGARAALLRFETHDGELFKKLRPGTSLKERIKRIKFLKKKGFVTATGFLAGLPGERAEDILKNIRLAISLKPDMISFGPVVPVTGTPMENAPVTGEDTLLKTIALTRLLHPESKILITSAMETLYGSMPESGLKSGGNSLMIDVTPQSCREKYKIYPGKEGNSESVDEVIKNKTQLLYSLGRAPTDLGI